MKRFAFIVGVFAIGALAFAMFGTYSRPVSESQGIVVATSTVSEETEAYTIDAEYPQFGIPAIDTQIQQIEFAAIDELKAQPTVPHGMSVAQNSFFGRFDNVYVGPDYVSVELSLSQYTGGAHPITAFSGLVFDRTTGERLTLEEVLPLVGKTLPELSASTTDMLSDSLGDMFMFAEGAKPEVQNFDSFTLDADTVTFILQQYQVAAYAAGPQRVRFARVGE